MQRRAREVSVDVVDFLVAVVQNEKEFTRERIIASGMILDRAWGRAKEMPDKHPKEVLADMSDEELAQHTAELLIEGGMPRATAIRFLRTSLKLDKERQE
jgi:hypothetical protein